MNGRGMVGRTGMTSAPSAVMATPSAVMPTAAMMATPSAVMSASAMAPLGLGETGREQHNRQNQRRSSYRS